MLMRLRTGADFAGRFVATALAAVFLFGLEAEAPTQTTDYRVGSGDLLKVTVFDHPELSADVRVSQSGFITYPLLGQVSVLGSSTHAVEMSIRKGLAAGRYVREAQVSVLVIDYQSQKISVVGQVIKPGQYALTTSNTVLDLLAQAGGVATGPAGVAGLAGDSAVLIRQNGSKVPIDLQGLFGGDPAQNPPVNPGDTIFVPRASQFYIYGEVQRPGIYRLERNMTVSQALSTGGGLTPRGSERRTLVKRRGADGKEVTTSVRASDSVQPDDVLLVRPSLF